MKKDKEKFWLKVNFCVVFVAFLLISIFNFIDIQNDKQFEKSRSNVYNTNIIYHENFTGDEKEYVQEILNDLKPGWVNLSKEITITKNSSYIYERCDYQDCAGVNDRKNNISILINGSICIDRINLCHEIVHSIVLRYGYNTNFRDYPGDEYFTEQIAETEVCFNNKRCNPIDKDLNYYKLYFEDFDNNVFFQGNDGNIYDLNGTLIYSEYKQEV